MRKRLALLMMIVSLPVMSAFPPAQNIIDQYVTVALYADVKELQGKSGEKWSCRFPIKYESLAAFGKDQEDAILHLHLLCIKDQCQQIIKKLSSKVNELQNLPEKEFRDLLEFSGRSAEEIEAAVKARENYSSSKTVGLSCNNSARFRMTAFDSCFSVPMECHQN